MSFDVMEKIIVDLAKISVVEAFRMKSMKLFFLEAEHEGKMMLEEASAMGQFDSTFVLGMMLMVEGRHRKHEALDMLNNAYHRAKGKWNLRAICSKVHLQLNREGMKHVHFHGFHRSCALHKMSNTRSRLSLDDLPLELLSRIFVVLGSESAKHIVSARLWGDPQVYRTACIDIFEGMGLTLLRKAADEDHLEAIYLHGMIYISRVSHQCDEGLQLLDAYFGWAFSDDGEYWGVVDSAKELLRAIDVVHRLTTNNVTFQCEDPRHSVKGALAIGYEKDEDQQRYCTPLVYATYYQFKNISFKPYLTNSNDHNNNPSIV
uniref:Uncharacterized protein n=1 Tax=Lactuca sativa TaxID=4236 RepID=A0A9R1USA7_LACSA|nr:hypothetical protein LSAT_V11C800436050 [Lactuca sativa]